MRAKKVRMTVTDVEVKVYNVEKKREEIVKATISDMNPEPILAAGLVKLSQSVIGEKNVEYTMTPEQFVKHAKMTTI